MTQPQLVHAIARATGESCRTVRRHGFQTTSRNPRADLEPEDLALAVGCPFCGSYAPLHGATPHLPEVASCERCDVEFAIEPDEIQAVSRALIAAASLTPRGIQAA